MTMSAPGEGEDPALALTLFVADPLRFGGVVLRGDGPVRDAMVAAATAALAGSGPVVRVPVNVDAERLLGGLDLAATLARGARVMRPGLLDAAAGGVVILPMAERIAPDIAAHVAQALDRGCIAAILLDDGRDANAMPPAVLTERIAFHVDVTALRGWPGLATGCPDGPATATGEQRAGIAATAAALGISSVRPLTFAERAASWRAALEGRSATADDDIAAAVRMVLAPRATRLPDLFPPADASDPQPPPSDPAEGEGEQAGAELMPPDDLLLEAAAAAIPPHILDQIERQVRGAARGPSGRAGDRQRAAQRGRPLSPRPGVPGQRRKLALIATLRAAAPWQSLRRPAGPRTGQRVEVRKSDLRVRQYEQRRGALTIFTVDASGSAALTRLAEAKGAVELMLAQAYVKRAEVALIAFRQAGAELLLPPTRSLTRARRVLAALPGGGGTPLAAGLIAAQALGERAVRAGQTPLVALLTDGKANVRRDGTAGRAEAMAEAAAAANGIARAGLASVVIDIAPRPTPEAAALAEALGGRYVPLPRADSAALVAALLE